MTLPPLDVRFDTSTPDEIERHLRACDHLFQAPLSARIGIRGYAEKLARSARRVEAWDGTMLVGLVASYVNADAAELFVSNVSVLEERSGQGLATRLMRLALDDAGQSGCTSARLEVSEEAAAANRLYRGLGFEDAGSGTTGNRTLKTSLLRSTP